MYSNRAFGPSSTITRNKYRYGDCVFSAETHTGKVVFAVVSRPKARGIVFVKTGAGQLIDLHDVSERVIGDSFADVSEESWSLETVFIPAGDKLNFHFSDGVFVKVTLSASGVDRGEQLLFAPDSSGISLPCTVKELYEKLGEPDEVQLAK